MTQHLLFLFQFPLVLLQQYIWFFPTCSIILITSCFPMIFQLYACLFVFVITCNFFRLDSLSIVHSFGFNMLLINFLSLMHIVFFYIAQKLSFPCFLFHFSSAFGWPHHQFLARFFHFFSRN